MYNSKGLEHDSALILKDGEFFFDTWLDLDKFNLSVVETPLLLHPLLKYNESLRFAEYVASTFEGECSNLRESRANKFQNGLYTESLNQQVKPSSHPDALAPSSVFLSSLPFRIKISNIPTISRQKLHWDVPFKQVKRDIERDKVVLNGRRIVGAGEGVEGVVTAIGDTVDTILVDCMLPPLGSSKKDNFAVSILRHATRTNSGGAAFQCLRDYTDPAEVMLAPVSHLTRAIELKLTAGSFSTSEDGNCIEHVIAMPDTPPENYCSSAMPRLIHRSGLKCHIRVSTYFRLVSLLEDDPTNSSDSKSSPAGNGVEVVYENLICAEVDPKGGEELTIFGINTTDGLTGSLEFKRIPIHVS